MFACRTAANAQADIFSTLAYQNVLRQAILIVANVQAFQIDGIKLWFWSNDHDPQHFHAKRDGEWEIRVFFLLDAESMFEVAWERKTPSRKVLKELALLVEEHRASLLEQWEETHK
jgi:hypothetical protein